MRFIRCSRDTHYTRRDCLSNRTPARLPKSGATNRSELSRHLLRAQEEERKRISRELHDGTGQSLMVLRFYLSMLAEKQNPELATKVGESLNLLDRIIEDVRRVIGRLSPRVLEELGLLAAIRKEARELSQRTGMKIHFELPLDLGQVDHEIEVAIYRSLQEALHNIAKHSHASVFTVKLQRKNGSLCLQVEDDGVGFSSKGNVRQESFGLVGMRERSAALGGKVRIRSSRGKGTRISVSLPVTRIVTMHKALPLDERSSPFGKRAIAARAG